MLKVIFSFGDRIYIINKMENLNRLWQGIKLISVVTPIKRRNIEELQIIKVYIKIDITLKDFYAIGEFCRITVLTIKKMTTKQKRWKKNNEIVKRET